MKDELSIYFIFVIIIIFSAVVCFIFVLLTSGMMNSNKAYK